MKYSAVCWSTCDWNNGEFMSINHDTDRIIIILIMITRESAIMFMTITVVL